MFQFLILCGKKRMGTEGRPPPPFLLTCSHKETLEKPPMGFTPYKMGKVLNKRSVDIYCIVVKEITLLI